MALKKFCKYFWLFIVPLIIFFALLSFIYDMVKKFYDMLKFVHWIIYFVMYEIIGEHAEEFFRDIKIVTCYIKLQDCEKSYSFFSFLKALISLILKIFGSWFAFFWSLIKSIFWCTHIWFSNSNEIIDKKCFQNLSQLCLSHLVSTFRVIRCLLGQKARPFPFKPSWEIWGSQKNFCIFFQLVFKP